MSQQRESNLAASVRQRLLNLSHQRQETFNFLMKQWQAFLNRNRLETTDLLLPEILTQLQNFLLPPWQAIANDQPFQATWTAKGPWQMSG